MRHCKEKKGSWIAFTCKWNVFFGLVEKSSSFSFFPDEGKKFIQLYLMHCVSGLYTTHPMHTSKKYIVIIAVKSIVITDKRALTVSLTHRHWPCRRYRALGIVGTKVDTELLFELKRRYCSNRGSLSKNNAVSFDVGEKKTVRIKWWSGTQKNTWEKYIRFGEHEKYCVWLFCECVLLVRVTWLNGTNEKKKEFNQLMKSKRICSACLDLLSDLLA